MHLFSFQLVTNHTYLIPQCTPTFGLYCRNPTSKLCYRQSLQADPLWPSSPRKQKVPTGGWGGCGSHNVEDNSTTHNTHKWVGYHQLSANNAIVRPKNLSPSFFLIMFWTLFFFGAGPTHILILLTTFFALVCNFTMEVRMEMGGGGTSSTKGKYQSWVGTNFGG